MCNGISKKIEDMKKQYTAPIEAELSKKEAELSDARRKIVKLMLKTGQSIGEIIKESGLSEEEIIKIKEELK